MKPKDLIPPYTRANQQIVMSDRVWYVPIQFNSPFIFPGWSHPDYFGNDNPVAIEYCSGNGAWIAKKAQENPLINWVAVEIKLDRTRKIWSKIKNHQLNNLIVICGEAKNATRSFLSDESISALYINFPDPWPKNRHTKNRLLSLEFLKECGRILKSSEILTFVTDDLNHSDWVSKLIQYQDTFQSLYPKPYYINDEQDYGTSYFDELWRSRGKKIYYHRYQKKIKD